ncbi:Protein FecR [compost metagenome]
MPRSTSHDHQPDTLTDQANAWVVLLTSGNASVEDAHALQAWCAQSPEHAQAYREAARLWRQVGQLAVPPRPAKRPALRLFGGGALAACLALLAIGAMQLGLLPATHTWLADHHTAVAERRELQLPDGSRVELDALSTLDVDFSDGQRRLELRGGAAIFHVRHDPARPFVVSAEGGTVTALGTVFEVRHQPEGVRVTCSEGVVAIRQPGFEQRLLRAGEQLHYGTQGPTPVAAVDSSQELAWRQGLLVFRDRPLRDLIDELNRYHRGRILILDERIARLPVSGVFHLQRPDEALRHIEQSLQLSTTRLPAGVILLR